MASPRNVYVMIIDTLRADALKGFSDNRACANFLEKKLQSGTRMTNYICSGGTTRVSVNSIFSGCYGGATGLNYQNCHQIFEQVRHLTMTEMFKCQGYQTIGMTQGHVSVIPNGFDHLYTEQQQFSVSDLQIHLAARTNNFVYLHFYGVHDPAFGYPEKMTRENYEQLVDSVSDEIENIWTKLITEDDVVVLLSDHGSRLRDPEDVNWRFYLEEEPTAGTFLSDHTIKGLCGFVAPRLFPEQQITNLSRGIDVLPTLFDALQLKHVPVQGESFWPTINSGVPIQVDFAFVETGGARTLDGAAPSMCVRTNSEKYIRYDTHGEQLFDLLADPLEQHNLLASTMPSTPLSTVLDQSVKANQRFLDYAVVDYPQDWCAMRSQWSKPNVHKGTREFAFSGLFDEQTRQHLSAQIKAVQASWLKLQPRIGLYSASEHAKTFLEMLPEELKTLFVGVIDGNSARHGDDFFTLPIVHVDNFEASLAVDIILVAHHTLASDMYINIKRVCGNQYRVYNIYQLQREIPLWWDKEA